MEQKAMKAPKTLQEAINYFADPERAFVYAVNWRWPDGVITCPRCGHDKHSFIKTRWLWFCKGCKKQFTVKVGTIFEDSPIPLDKWMTGMWMLVNCKNGVSSYELSRTIGITQKSAWFVLQRIRAVLQPETGTKVGGEGSTVEADETVIGGKLKNMHGRRKQEMGLGQYGGFRRHQSYVMGVLDRDARQVRATVLSTPRREPMEAMIRDHVEPGTTMMTDAHTGYDRLKNYFSHEVINHMEAYVRGRVHTNGIENFWSLLKRGLNGTYISVESFHLFRYVDEQVFRYNNRGGKKREDRVTDSDRFNLALSKIAGKRLTFAEVTGKSGSQANT
jgi:transposase-like protein